ncbi:methyltransferase domain-containing protein [Streptomyces sp. NPDC090106]|uniref:methyltransferase domain-containing protein n=1 Tax=Streptomyces sp. NPDC090106 TaxID=3365946 RepID=UPI0037F5B9F1
MPLATLDEIRDLLICPRCRSPLTARPGTLRCRAADCPYGAPSGFPTAGRRPVLVDFERSAVTREEVAAAAPGPARRLPAALRRAWKPRNRVAVRNADLLLGGLGGAPVVLVVGGATVGNGVDAVYREPGVRVVAFDLAPSPVTQFVADAHRIPLAAASVDAVVVQAVLEHVLDPAAVVAEIHRVLTADGLVYAETPFLQQVHAGPLDFTRFTASGHRRLFGRFEEIAAGPVAGPGTQLLWSVDHLVRGVTRSASAGRVARGLCCWLRALDRLVPEDYARDSASALYFLGRRREREMTDREVVAYYRGAQTSARGARSARTIAASPDRRSVAGR